MLRGGPAIPVCAAFPLLNDCSLGLAMQWSVFPVALVPVARCRVIDERSIRVTQYSSSSQFLGIADSVKKFRGQRIVFLILLV